MALFKAVILFLLVGVFLYYMLWKIGGFAILFGLLSAAMAIFAAYYWLALKD